MSPRLTPFAIAAVVGLGAEFVPAPGPAFDPHRSSPAVLHAEGPPPGHTGGFGEPTCVACHNAFPLNPEEGRLALDGLPGVVDPGERYALTVTLDVEGTVLAGFQLSARTPDGAQAGRFESPDPRVAVTTPEAGRVEYAHTTLEGSRSVQGDRATWTVLWEAPRNPGTVVFNLASNSADGDNSPFGDLVFALERRIDGPE